MHIRKTFDFGLYIAAVNIFAYSIVFLNLFTTLIFEFVSDAANEEENSDPRYSFYLTLSKGFLSTFSLIMIIASINLLRGIMKKSHTLINLWLTLSFCVLVYQAGFLLDAVLFYIAYGYTVNSPLVLLGLCNIFGLHIFGIRKILAFYLCLHRNNLLQREQISSSNNSSANSRNYMKNLIQNDPSALAPLNKSELKEEYKNTSRVNSNNFEI